MQSNRAASISRNNEPFLTRDRGNPVEYGAGLKLAIERGWLTMQNFRHLHAGWRRDVRLMIPASADF
jgi:hypothetical protein